MSVPDLWSFSLALYAAPGVAEACLTAQDRQGADVNLLLWAAWLAVQGHDLRPDELAAARAATAPWRDEIVRPLRAVRRRLKTGPFPAPDAMTESLRNQVKMAELAAEQVQQSLLQTLPAARRTGGAVADLLQANLSLLPGGDVLAAVTIPLHADLRDGPDAVLGSPT
ncbi:TIGR02444 family protein [Niveispirillum sp.]|uniref:TIGR02444 family protein n=1 Tax=Niveispirillum sp. TaxID=1917217 RepID=UPI001B3FA865|nr:TIGR02444 family protein [Niveispirillum sp.]MBP7336607.1 TIGR02444 family protein [Niveispirillum sp.]